MDSLVSGKLTVEIRDCSFLEEHKDFASDLTTEIEREEEPLFFIEEEPFITYISTSQPSELVSKTKELVMQTQQGLHRMAFCK